MTDVLLALGLLIMGGDCGLFIITDARFALGLLITGGDCNVMGRGISEY
jgi:hypothetical protein